MQILPEEVKKKNNNKTTQNKPPTTSTYLRYFVCSKKPDLGLEDGQDVTRAGWLVLGPDLQAGAKPGGGEDRMRPPEQDLSSWSH